MSYESVPWADTWDTGIKRIVPGLVKRKGVLDVNNISSIVKKGLNIFVSPFPMLG